MNRIPGITAACLLAAFHVSLAQEPAPADSSAFDVVTSVSIKSGRLALATAGVSEPMYLPDGAYRSDTKTVLVILDGRISRVEYASGTITPVASARMERGRVMLTPPVGALMQVTPFPLPTGTFTNEDASVTLKVVSGQPRELRRRPVR